MQDARLPVTLFTGFLGSGKTTLLNRLIRTPAFAKSAVIINELGEIAVDQLLVDSPDEQLMVLDNGCICCSARGDLAGALRKLALAHRSQGSPPFDRVLVETTGVADPVPLMETLCEDQHMVSEFRAHGVVTTVDSVNALEQLDTFAEPAKQVAIADRLLITKTDLAESARIERVEAALRALNPGAATVRIVTSQASADEALGDVWRPEQEGTFDWFMRAAQVKRALGALSHPHLAAAGEVDTFAIWHDKPVTRAGLVLWLDKMAGLKGAKLLRVKGVLNVEGEPIAVHAVQRIVHEPVILPRWPDPDRRSRLVFITRGLEREAIDATLDVLGFEIGARQGRLVDPSAYARFINAAARFRA